MDWIGLAKDGETWRDLVVNAVMNLRGSIKCLNFMTS